LVPVAIDIGASSGKIVIGEMINEKLSIKEIYRFENSFNIKNGTLYWNIDYLLKEVLKGLQLVKKAGYDRCTVGIDTWAVDYVLLGDDGKRLKEVVSYRDNRTKNTINKLTKRISKKSIYKKTGIQFMPINTIYQLYEEDKTVLEKTNQILMVPDYLNYRLTGISCMETTNASTTQLLNIKSSQFDDTLMGMIGVKRSQFPQLIEAGNVLGTLKKQWFPEFDLPHCQIINIASHDTASAVVGIPATNKNWAYLSSGTWSLLGVELEKPIINDAAFKGNYTNEWGACRTFRFLKNIMGMWIFQNVIKELESDLEYEELIVEAKKVKPFQQYINFNDNRFLNPESMVDSIQTYCKETNQIVPKTPGELSACIFNNLAIIYSIAIEELENITNKTIDHLYIVGGGGRNMFLNQLTANLSGKKVLVGPSETTSIGNIIMQLIAKRKVTGIQEGREIISKSFELKEFNPEEIDRKVIKSKFFEVTRKIP